MNVWAVHPHERGDNTLPLLMSVYVLAVHPHERGDLDYFNCPRCNNENDCLVWFVAILEGESATTDCRNCSPYCVKVLGILRCYFVGRDSANPKPLPT